MIQYITIDDRVYLDGRFRNSFHVGEETTYLLPRANGVEFDLNGQTYLIPWGSIKLVSYA